MTSLLQIARQALSYLKQRAIVSFYLPNYAPVVVLNNGQQVASSSIEELMKESIVWGVPKKRVPIERRLGKRFGVPNYPENTRLVRPRVDLVLCDRCGDHHEAYALCPTCYNQVMEETKRIKEAITSQTDPVQPKHSEVYVKYQEEDTEDLPKGHRVIEIDRPRPPWFSKNLLSKSTGHSKLTRQVIMNPEDLIEKPSK